MARSRRAVPSGNISPPLQPFRETSPLPIMQVGRRRPPLYNVIEPLVESESALLPTETELMGNSGRSLFDPACARRHSFGMQNESEKTPKHPLPSVLPRDPRASETLGRSPKPSDVHIGPDNTIGPSVMPANATLPPAEAVVPGKGRAPK